MSWILYYDRRCRENCIFPTMQPVETLQMTTDIERYIAGETLEGDAARKMFNELQNRPWRFWVSLALEYLQQNQPEQAEQILKQLIESTL